MHPWLTSGVPDDMIAIKGFDLARLDRRWSENTVKEPKKGGGLICYVREGIYMNEFRYEKLNCSCKNPEMQWVSLEMGNMRRIVLINIYRPPQGNY